MCIHWRSRPALVALIRDQTADAHLQDPTLGKDATILKSIASVDPLADDSDTRIEDLQHRPRVPKLPFVTMDRPLHNASFLEDTSNAERRIDTAPKAKAGVANPGRPLSCAK